MNEPQTVDNGPVGAAQSPEGGRRPLQDRQDLPVSVVVPQGMAAERADRALPDIIPGDMTRSAAARLLKQGRILANGLVIRPSTVLRPGDQLQVLPDDQIREDSERADIPCVPIIFEDDDLIIVNKPPALVVHAGAGRESVTLTDILSASRPCMVGVGEPGRWGVVHRLDRDTSGVMVLAKTQRAHSALSLQFKEHSIYRKYLALVRGNPREDKGIIDAELGRHAKDRKRISTITRKGRRAVTRWRVLERFDAMTLLEITPETGRTHQIRVHLASRGMPVAGDAVYGRTRKKITDVPSEIRKVLACLTRQALHAAVLGFEHPADRQYIEFSCPLPDDMMTAIAKCHQSPTDGNR